MAKLSTVAALLVALFLIAHATACKSDDRQGDRECREQLQEQQYLNECQRHLRQQSQSGRVDEDTTGFGERQQRKQCCRQLRQMDRDCRCEGLNEMIRRQRDQFQGQELREMMQIAENLPNECNLSPHHCDIEMRRSHWF
ncbi:hypothetical protein ACJW30_06G045900 [Castanea mollissima]